MRKEWERPRGPAMKNRLRKSSSKFPVLKLKKRTKSVAPKSKTASLASRWRLTESGLEEAWTDTGTVD